MSIKQRGRRLAAIAVGTCLALVVGSVTAPAVAAASAPSSSQARDRDDRTEPVLLFAADGMRQDLIEKYTKDRRGSLPGFADLLRHGASASGGGMLTQAPPNTGAGWYTMATGAWPGVTGSTNNTFAINTQPLNSSTSAFTPGTLQAETIAQSAERGGKKVIQLEWAGGANGKINGPTVDFRSFFSGRGVTTTFVSPSDRPNLITQFGLQYDQVKLVDANGWTGAPVSFSPAKETHMAVLDFGTDKYGLDAYIYDSTDDHRVNYDRVLFARNKNGAAPVADLRAGGLADVKVSLDLAPDNALDGKTAGMLVKVEALNADASQLRLFHTSVSRANATWAGWPGEPGFTGDFAEYVAQKFPTSTAGDFAVIEAGVVSEETYVQQALYWEKAHQPLLRYLINTYHPDLALVGYPATDEIQHQFLGLVSPTLAKEAANPAYDDITLDGIPDGRVRQREAFIRRAYQGADATMRLAQRLLGKHTTTFVGSDHGFAPQFLAVDASKVLVDLGLLSKPQTANCRPAAGETIGKAKACWAGGTVQIYLNVAGRTIVPTPSDGFQQVPASDVPTTLAAIKAAFLALSDPNDWTHDGQPEGWKVIDRVFTQAEARYIPNGPGSTSRHGAPDPHRRPGGLRLPAVPIRRGDARHAGRQVGVLRPARLRSRRAGPGEQHQHAGHLPGRRRRDRQGPVHRAVHRHRAHRRVSARRAGAATGAGQGAAEPAEGRPAGHPAEHHRAQRLPRSAGPDHDADGRRERRRRRRRPAGDHVRRGREEPAGPRRCCWPAATTSARHRRIPACCRTSRPSTWRTRGAWTRRPTATTSSTTASNACSRSRRRPRSRSWPPTSSTRPPARRPIGSRRPRCSG